MNEHPRVFSATIFKSAIIFLLLCRLISMAVMPVMDDSEARYAAIAANMAKNGDFFAPQFCYYGETVVFYGKPPFFFQFCGAMAKWFGTSEFTIRIPALLSALLIVGILWLMVKQLRGKDAAADAVLLCCLSGGFYLYSGLCMTDLMLAAACFGAVGFYLLFDQESTLKRKKLWSVCVFASFGLGMIVKGPVVLVFSGIPVFLYVLCKNRWRDLKNHSWVCGIVVLLLIIVPSYGLMQMRNPDFLRYFFVDENFRRFLYHDYGDRFGQGREYFHGVAFLWFILVNLPLLLLIPTACFGKNSWKKFFPVSIFRDPLELMMLLSIFTALIFWSLTSRTLVTYLLPTMPVLAAFVASRLHSLCCEGKTFAAFRRTAIVFIVISGVGILAMSFWGDQFTTALARQTYKSAEKLLPEYPGSRIYIMRYNPYSAEFYLPGEALIIHPKEKYEESLANSGGDILLAPERYWKRIKDSTKRKELFRYGKWKAFAPVGPEAEPLDK